MAEESIYYTPSLGEFHVGFEFEIDYKDGNGWVSTTLSPAPRMENAYSMINILQGMDFSNIRVKYLDREDIESFGYTYDEADHCYYKSYYNGQILKLEYIVWYVKDIGSSEEGTRYSILKLTVIDSYNLCTVRGIKNKGELKKILENHE